MAEIVLGIEVDGSGVERGILEAFKKAESAADQGGARAGEAWNKQATERVKFDRAIGDQFQETTKLAGKAGGAAGDGYGKSAGSAAQSSLKGLLPEGWDQGKAGAVKAAGVAGGLYGDEGAAQAAKVLADQFRKSWGTGKDTAASAGSGAGSAYGGSSGDAIQSLLGRTLVQGWTGGEGAAESGGSAAGVTFADAAGDGVVGGLPSGFTAAFRQGQGIASGAGGEAGKAFGAAASSSIGARQDLFDALVVQAEKAAADVGLIFNKVDLSFRVPDGGVLPSGVLDQLRQADQMFDQVVTRLGEFSVAAGMGEGAGEGLGQAFERLGGQGRIMDNIIQGVAFSLANTLTNAAGQVVGSLGAAVNTFSSLDAEIRLAAAAAGQSDGYDRLGAVISEVGIEAAGSTLDVAKLTTELLRGGLTLEEVEGSLGGVVRGAEATGTAYAQMGSVVAATLKGFGLEASETSRVVDALVQGANESAASVEGMGYAFKYAAPVAKILGLEVEDVALAVGLMTNAGIDAAEAGVSLRNGLSKLASAAPQTGDGVQKLTGQAAMAAETMKQLGLDIYNADGTLKPMETTLLQLKGAFDKLDPATKIRMAANLFGGEDDGAKFLAVLGQSVEDIKKLATSMANAQGATDKAKEAMRGFDQINRELSGTLEGLQADFGKVIAAALTPFLELANAVAGVLKGLPGPVKDVVFSLALLSGAFAAAVTASVALQAALKTTIVLDAIAQYKVFSAEIVRAATTVIPSLITSLKALWVAMNATTLASAAGQLKVLAAGMASVAASAVGMLSDVVKAQGGIKGMATSVLGLTASMVPLAVIVAGIAAPIATYNEIMGDSRKIAEQLTPAYADLAKGLEKAGFEWQGAAKQGNIFQQAMNNIRFELGALGNAIATTLENIVRFNPIFALVAETMKRIEEAKTSRAIAELGARTNELTANTTQATNSMAALLAEVESAPQSAAALDSIAKRLIANQEVLSSAEKSVEKYISSLKAMAEAAKNSGNTEQEAAIRKVIVAMEAELANIQMFLGKAKEKLEANKALQKAYDAQAKSAEQLTKWREAMEKQGAVDMLKAEAAAYTEVANGITTQEAAQIRLRDATIDSIKQQMEALAEQIKQQGEAGQKDAENAENRKRFFELEKQYAQERVKLTTEIIEAERELNRVIAEAPVRDLTASLEFGSKLAEFAKAASDYEQARFNTAKARNDYELKKAQERGASEQEIEAIKRRGEEIEKASLLARATALATQIKIEQRSLEITQQKALLEANLKVNEQRVKLLEQEAKYQEALLTGNPQLIQLEGTKLGLAQQALGLAQDNLGLIRAQIPLENQTLALKQAAAQEQIKAEGAAKGMNIQFTNSIAPLTNANVLAGQYADNWLSASNRVIETTQGVNAGTGAVVRYRDEMGRVLDTTQEGFTNIGTTLGAGVLQVKRLADGSVEVKQLIAEAVPEAELLRLGLAGGAEAAVELGSKVGDATGATRGLVAKTGLVPGGLDEAVRTAQSMGYEINRAQAQAILAAQATGGIGAAARGAASQVQSVATQASNIQDPLRKAIAELAAAKAESERWRQKAAEVTAKFGDTATAAGRVKGKVDEVRTATDAIRQSPLEKFFLDVAKRGLGPVEQGLLTALQAARNLASEKNVGLLGYFASVGSTILKSIGGALDGMISKAQRLAGLLFRKGKWAGGDVAAGSSWTVNELGQESFLSASGGLSLINRPAYGSWTAPTKGLVIPAGVTSKLKEAGAFDRTVAPMAAVFGGKMGAAAPAGVSSHTVNHVTIAAAEPTDSAARLMMNVARIRARGRRF